MRQPKSSRRGGSLYGCLRKKQYATQVEAQQAAAAITARNGEPVTAFLCGICGSYHCGGRGRRART